MFKNLFRLLSSKKKDEYPLSGSWVHVKLGVRHIDLSWHKCPVYEVDHVEYSTAGPQLSDAVRNAINLMVQEIPVLYDEKKDEYTEVYLYGYMTNEFFLPVNLYTNQPRTDRNSELINAYYRASGMTCVRHHILWLGKNFINTHNYKYE